MKESGFKRKQCSNKHQLFCVCAHMCVHVCVHVCVCIWLWLCTIYFSQQKEIILSLGCNHIRPSHVDQSFQNTVIQCIDTPQTDCLMCIWNCLRFRSSGTQSTKTSPRVTPIIVSQSRCWHWLSYLWGEMHIQIIECSSGTWTFCMVW